MASRSFILGELGCTLTSWTLCWVLGNVGEQVFGCVLATFVVLLPKYPTEQLKRKRLFGLGFQKVLFMVAWSHVFG
jgi:hypothetical protein